MEFRKPVQTATGELWPDHVVVGLPHLALVYGVLNHDLGVELDPKPLESPELGLALIQLADVSKAAADLQARRTSARSGDLIPRLVENAVAAYRGAMISDLDLVMDVLRGWLAQKNQGWNPVLGKNRVLKGVQGLPEIGGGTEGDPEPLRSGSLTIPLPSPVVGRRVRVGVLDTPLFAHPALVGRYVAQPDDMLKDEVFSRPRVPFLAGHATFIAGVVAQNAPDAELDVRSVLAEDSASASAWDVARRMVAFRGSGVDILNMSFGCATDDGKPPLLLSRAVDQLSPEIVLIAAAGNHGAMPERAADDRDLPSLTNKTPYWPAALQDVCAVGALDGNVAADFTPRVPWVDHWEPGVRVSSTYLPGPVPIPVRDEYQRIIDYSRENFGKGYAEWGGTSVAAGVASGRIAALAQQRSWTAREALEFLLKRSENGPGGDSRQFHTEM